VIPTSELPVRQERVTRAVEEYLALCEAGNCPGRLEFLARYRDVADALAECLDGLDFIRSAAPGLKDSALAPSGAETMHPEGPLGDFRIVREVGRGGMGVVYEAVQISLGRRVALKVLPFASTMDSRQLQRFKNEAQAAAHLHHQNIVPVYATGCERGVHYYAMQFIEGQTLAAAIAELREAFGPRPTGEGNARAEPSTARSPQRGGGVMPPTRAAGGLTTERSVHSPGYFRAAVRLAVQAAEALEFAHQMGVIHRDVKPANLLVDDRGNLWVTDFGLAHCQGNATMTMTGDLVGTLRYMSPEQALARPAGIDHRTDVYSLGATLYELLTLEPAFAGHDRQQLLRQVAFEDPKPPSRYNKALPRELETLLLKSLEKSPGQRYATAADLADDLRRYLEDKPIRARRPGLWQKAKKWAWRNRAVVWTAAACLLLGLAVAAACAGWMLRDRAERRAFAKDKIELALRDADRLQAQERWPEALEAAKRAEAILAQCADRELDEGVAQLRKDLEMVIRLERIRLPRLEVQRESDAAREDRAYGDAFGDYGIDVDALAPAEAAARIRDRAIHVQLIVAVDRWAKRRKESRPTRDASWKRLVAVAATADTDELRKRLRQAIADDQLETLNQLARSDNVADLPLQTLSLLGDAPIRDPEPVLRLAQRKYPDDFEINFQLGWVLKHRSKPELDEVIRFYTVALALRPRSLPTHCWLAGALQDRGRLDEAIAVYRRAVELDREYLFAVNLLAAALCENGESGEAAALYGRVYEAQPESASACNNLSCFLATCPDPEFRDVDRAVRLAKKAVELMPDRGRYWNTLGLAQYRAGHWRESQEALEKSLQLLGDYDEGRNTVFLAMVQWKLGDPEVARKRLHQAVTWIERHQPGNCELRRFRTEAEELLRTTNTGDRE
jgi:serine/threonine protein kinase/Tfp pilus assembly protein PilF